jgi:nitrate/nitrite transporter NarK
MLKTALGALRGGHWPSLAGAWLHFEVSFMAWLLIGAAGGLGGFLLPSWLGLFKDTTGTYQSGFLLFAVLAMVAAMSVAVAVRRNRLAGGGRRDQADTPY